MKIIINYDSCWRNSFLKGSNNEPLPDKGRKFIGSMISLKNDENFNKRDITLNTIMGVVNRLIGDQRKLYQARLSGNYYFKDIDYENTNKVKFTDYNNDTNEMTYIRNITGNTSKSTYNGALMANNPMFKSDYSAEFWGVLALDFEQLCDFILNNTTVKAQINLDPESVVGKFEERVKLKAVENEGSVNDVVKFLNECFENVSYVETKGNVLPYRLYCAALYLQLDRLSKHYDMTTAKTKSGKVAGCSKRGFNGYRDFMVNFVTGGAKKIYGNPYLRKERIKDVGEVVSIMTKASGKLEIELDVERSVAKEIKIMIENAGVSSFYLGKKGLAYVDSISTRPMKQ